MLDALGKRDKDSDLPYNTNPLDPPGGYKFHLKCCEMCHVTPGDYVMEAGECASGHMNFPMHLLQVYEAAGRDGPGSA